MDRNCKYLVLIFKQKNTWVLTLLFLKEIHEKLLFKSNLYSSNSEILMHSLVIF